MIRNRYFQKEKHESYRVKMIDSRGKTGSTIQGWWIVEPPNGICTCAEPKDLTVNGWCQSVACSMICWPFFWSPCILSCNYDAYQTPVFDDPNLEEEEYETL